MAIKRIVVATDGSEPAQRAVAWSAELATSLNAEITAVHAIGRTYHPAQMASAMYVPDDYEAMLKEVNETLMTQWCQPLRDAHVRFHCLVRDGAPAEMILLTALDEHADLIVMATHGSGGLARWAFGSVTNNVLHNTTAPTLVVHASVAEDPSARPRVDGIIVPLDGSPTAEEAIPIAQDIATGLALPLQIVRVISNASSLLYRDPLADDAAIRRLSAALAHARSNAERAVEAIVARLNSATLRATGTVFTGDPAAVLSAYLREQPDSLVVMASHGEHDPQPWLFGNVAEKIVATAPNPTLVVHPSSRVVPFLHVDPALAARYPD